APWVDLGWCGKFARKSETKVGGLTTGAPAMVQSQVRTQVEATVQLEFESWGKLQLALAAGSQQMNLLRTASGAAAKGSGGVAAGMEVSPLAGFVDREGGGFFQEWSGLFVMDGEQGDRVIYHYPRLQAMQASAEVTEALAGPLERVKLAAAFRALPVKDANDG